MMGLRLDLLPSLLLLLLSFETAAAFSSPSRYSTTTPRFHHSTTTTTTLSLSSSSNNNNENEPNTLSRRQLGELAVAATGLGLSYAGTREVDPTDYGLWGILPVGTYRKKKTVLETIVPGQLWTLDQKFGILNVQVPLRMVVIRLADGGLFCYNPIAATQEMLGMLQTLVAQYGPLRHICVGSVALEHKVYAGVLAQKFPNAQVWLQPGQYSFPANLPDTFLGFPGGGRTQTMPATIDDAPAEWKASGLDFQILGPIISRDGAFGETVFYHQPTQTLLCTDTCVQVTDEVPAIYDSDPAPLLYHARDTVTEVVEDTPETRARGWRRVVLFGLYFMPSAIMIKDVQAALDERRPDINSDFAGVYPWDWVGDEQASWIGLTGTAGNKPLVAPILQTLLLNRSPIEVLDFADKVAQWPFTRIIPAHLKNNLSLTGAEYRKAFDFLTVQGVPDGYPKPLAADLQTLVDAEASLIEQGAIVPSPGKVGGDLSRAEILERTVYKCRSGVCAPRSKA